jgi:mono/diheme cytochrome c family protein
MHTPQRRTSNLGRAFLVTLGVCAALAANADDGSRKRASSATNTGTNTAAPTASASTEGRLLASNCFQCHGTNGTGGFDSIRGSEANEVLEFLTKTASKDIMAAHAQGYTRAQLLKIIAYLQQ